MTSRLLMVQIVILMTTVFGLIAASPPDPTRPTTSVKAALDAALDDERHAVAFYEAVMAVHGARRPFSNIVHAERRHAEALLSQYDRLGLIPPDDAWAGHAFDVPAQFKDACDLSIVSEIKNVRLYDTLIADVDDEDVRVVFQRLQRASQTRHLPAFRRHGSGWTTVELSALSSIDETHKARADNARSAMFDALFARLSSAIQAHGAAGAIEVCATEAPRIAATVAEEHEVRIGRTALRLRNPDNTAPVWADMILPEDPTETVVMKDRAGRLGVLTPIHLKTTCLQCHGPREDLAPDVIDELRRRYPLDEATGFAVGDLRGWFWVEVGPPTR